MSQLDFWFEFASTYSYPAAMRIESLAEGEGVSIVWRPFLLGPIFREQGWDDSPFNLFPAKGRYMWRDLERICAEQGLALRRPSTFPRNGLLAARLACAASSEPWLPEFVRRVYRANFADDQDISDPAVLESILEALGQPAAYLAQARSPEAKARLRSETEEAASLGIFGAPTFAAGGELFWGNDRLESALRRAASAARPGQAGELTRFQLHGMQPVLGVPDVNETVAFYRDQLGFHVDFVEGDPPVHARVCADPTYSSPTVHIRFEPLPGGASVDPSVYLWLHVGADLDELFAVYRGRGVEVVEEPADRPWGLRQFTIKDCNGYVATFCAEIAAD